MARIRTIKPEFFRHEQLQDLEADHPGQYCMLVFIGLWTQSDNNGIFQDRPRQLKLDILPFLNFDFEDTLSILQDSGFIYRYEMHSGRYAIIPTIPMHQRFSGKEAGEAGSRYPMPPDEDLEAFIAKHGIYRETIGKQQGSDREQPIAQEKERSIGKGKDRDVFPENKKTKPKTKKLSENQFEKFWEQYPKKVGKGAARKSFLNIKLGDSDPDQMFSTLVTALKNQTQSPQWKKENGKFIPNPSTWINQERWQDEIEIPEYQTFPDPPPDWKNRFPTAESTEKHHDGLEGI